MLIASRFFRITYIFRKSDPNVFFKFQHTWLFLVFAVQANHDDASHGEVC
jgi:hypothetical protein